MTDDFDNFDDFIDFDDTDHFDDILDYKGPIRLSKIHLKKLRYFCPEKKSKNSGQKHPKNPVFL